MGVEKMDESNQQRQMEPTVGLTRLTGLGLLGVAEPFAWLDALFVDPPRRSLRVLHADELEALLDEELIEDDAEEPEVAKALVEAKPAAVSVDVVAPVAAKATAPAAAVARDPLANMVLDALHIHTYSNHGGELLVLMH